MNKVVPYFKENNKNFLKRKYPEEMFNIARRAVNCEHINTHPQKWSL